MTKTKSKSLSIVLIIALLLSLASFFTLNTEAKAKESLKAPSSVKITASAVPYGNCTRIFIGHWNKVKGADAYKYVVKVDGKTVATKTTKGTTTCSVKVKRGSTMSFQVQSFKGKKSSGWSKTASKKNNW